eukprot:CAMPEP_0185756112 /NCGR_PEP_ID=MMETSP1174-20130828/14556_1 /TAXON_ID=35687 /ORGANISM="Dictyocha speculum, Strain CCMP1381" /LENGTH=262 /DNA_ID=CAMNT_0028434933 /DNA_START=56 /DNA_END=844 /DNA_ORIENTATION=+
MNKKNQKTHLATLAIDDEDTLDSDAVSDSLPQWASSQNVDRLHLNEDRTAIGPARLWTNSGDEDGSGCNVCSAIQAALEEDLEPQCLETHDRSGACVCLAVISGSRMWVGNVGDCRAVGLAFDGTHTILSVDHRASSGSDEFIRVAAAGGKITSDGRIEGILAVTRALGDADIKGVCPHGVVLATPDIRIWQRKGLVVLATDGVWDVMSVSEVAALLPSGKALRRACEQGVSFLRSVAEMLVEEAITRGSEDDVTAVVMPFL